jgi:hypothetical protein
VEAGTPPHLGVQRIALKQPPRIADGRLSLLPLWIGRRSSLLIPQFMPSTH